MFTGTMMAPPPPNSQFPSLPPLNLLLLLFLFLHCSWMESLCWGVVLREGLGTFPGSSRFLEGRLEGAQWLGLVDWWGVLYGLSFVDTWASGQGKPASSLWSSLTAVASKAPSHCPSILHSSLALWVPGPTNDWSGLARRPASLSLLRDSERGKTEIGLRVEPGTGHRGQKERRAASRNKAQLRGKEGLLAPRDPYPLRSWWC